MLVAGNLNTTWMWEPDDERSGKLVAEMFDEQIEAQTAAECAKRLHGTGVEIVGLNCMRDPTHMYPLIQEMRDAFDGYLAAQPVAFRTTDDTLWFTGLPSFPDKLEPTQLTRFELGEFAARAKDMGVNYIGGCCGCKATHMREMAAVLGKYEEKHHWNRDATAMSETEFNKQTVGKECIARGS